MKKLLLIITVFILSAWGQSLMAQAYTFTSGQKTYSENFDAMGSAGTAFLTGWTAIRSSGTGTVGAVLTMAVTDGSANSGNVYNVGAAASEERAFGTLGSATTVPQMGASFLNNTGESIIKIDLAGMMEQWRSGSNAAVNEVVVFEYSLNATDLATGTWTPVTGFDLMEKITSSTVAAALDGNLAENQTAISASITGLAWFPGSNLWIRWTDVNDLGSDGIYAIDNLTMTVSTGTVTVDPEPANYPTSFEATAGALSITLGWTDATGGQLPAGYLIKASKTDNITVPADGTAVADDIDLSDGAGAKNIAQGIQTYSFTNLEPGTHYFFKIFPYTNSGTAIDFKTDGTIPSIETKTKDVINSQTFITGFDPWTAYNVIGDSTVWIIDLTHGVGGTACAKMSGYKNSVDYVNEDWLISPALNFDENDNEMLSFQTAMQDFGIGNSTFAVWASSDYTAGSNPSTNGTWTELDAVLSPGSYAWTQSGLIDVSTFTGTNVHIAFQYTSDTSSSRTWEVDEVLISGDHKVGINESKRPSTLSIYPNPGNGNVRVTMPGQGNYELIVYSLIGELLYTTDFIGASEQVNLSFLPKGVYIVNTNNTVTRETSCSRLIIK
jgi:trimeric autotransporter adhesin